MFLQHIVIIYIYVFSRHFYPKRLTVHSGYNYFQYMCSLGIEPTNFCAANTMLYHWATATSISEGSWDTEDWSNDAENSALQQD